MKGRLTYEKAAISIVTWLHLAEDSLLGHTVATFNGEAGTVLAIRLDDAHGLCFTLDEDQPSLGVHSRRWYPVSTIKSYGAKS